MLERVKAKVYVNKAEAEGTRKVAGLGDSDLVKMEAGDTLKFGDLTIKFLHTPGHTPGSQCFLVEGNLISGDTLFVNSCGRVDLPGSDPEAMYYSLNRTLRNLRRHDRGVSRARLFVGIEHDDRRRRSDTTCTCAFRPWKISSTRWATRAAEVDSATA